MLDFLKIITILAIAIILAFYFVGKWTGNDYFGIGSPAENTERAVWSESKKEAPGIYQSWRSRLITSEPKPSPTSSAPAIPDSRIPYGFTREQLSPYFEKIKISSISRSWGGYTPSRIQISASFSYSQNESVNITGWRLKSNHGEILIPQAIEVYSPLILGTEKDIVLARGNYVNIYSGVSPINRNFRLNKCIGYLENIYDFNPPLPRDCPSIPRDEYKHLSGQCQSYLMSLGRCKLPDASFSNSLPGNAEGNACREFLNTISHENCFRKHRGDADFLSREWRVWVNQDILDPRHDQVLLFDKNGLLVDEYTY